MIELLIFLLVLYYVSLVAIVTSETGMSECCRTVKTKRRFMIVFIPFAGLFFIVKWYVMIMVEHFKELG